MRNSQKDLAPLIAQHGWTVVTVEEAKRDPGFAYSVGLFQTFQHPEIIIFGLPSETMEELIDTIGDMVRDGLRLTDGSRSSDLLEGYDVMFRSVAAAAKTRYCGLGMEYYAGADFAALQCVWPDRDGRYPWDPKTDRGFRRLQPMLVSPLAPSSVPRPSDD